MMSKFTEKQQKVININDGNVVVSASAGSGKTSVMIERIIRLICDGKANISEILAVTFTKLSAKEIKDRISKVLWERISEGDNKELFKAQIENLPTASISTVHSFCSDVIKTYFYEAEVDPSFSVLDDAGAKFLKQRAINDVFERLYDEGGEEFILLLKCFIKNRSDQEFKKHVIECYDYAINEEDFDAYIEKALYYSSSEGAKIADNQLIDEYRRLLHGYAQSLLSLLEYSEKYNETKLAIFFKGFYDKILQAINNENFEDVVSELSLIKPKRPTVEINPISEALIKEYKDFREKKFNKVVAKVTEAFLEPQDIRIAKILSTNKICNSFIKVVKLFKEEYERLKQDLASLDFSDLEHFTLKILKNEEIRKEISERYKYIFVDEYQDTNGVQEAIFAKISNNNLFIVGDVKQSIYAFRGCNPELFNQKIKDCENGYGTHVDLDANFRSAISIIDATNKVFSGSMRENPSGIEYSRAPMQGGSLYDQHLGKASLYIAEKNQKEKSEFDGVYSVKKHAQKFNQATVGAKEKLVCDLIEDELFGLNGSPKTFYDVKDKKVREVTFSDICVLTRNNTGLSERIVSELLMRSIPVICDNKRSIGEYPEIKLMVNLLEYIVNPTKDIPLATVLKSEIGGLTDDELSTIRQNFVAPNFYLACEGYAKKFNDAIAVKLNDFFDYFKKIRILSQFEKASRVLKEITTERNLEISLLTKKLGNLKLTRINRFILAGENMLIAEMLAKINNIIENLTVNFTEAENAVKIMSYHGSKGLEFPIVILADVSQGFNKLDLRKEVMLDREFGFVVKYYDTENKISQPTSLRRLITLRKDLASATEELRLFYVAMTRARYRLHIVSGIEPSLMHNFEGYALANKMIDFLAKDDVEICDAPKIFEKEANLRREVIFGEPDQKTVEKISEFINFEYPYSDDTTLYLKRSVTQVNENNVESFDGLEFSQREETFMVEFKEDDENLQEKGTAYHRYLETCDFGKQPNNELIRLHNEGLLSSEQVKMLDISLLEKIVKMDIFTRLKDAKLYRERPFILNAPASLVGFNGTDTVLLQGIIDLIAIDCDSAYVIDYKYSSKKENALIETYKKQLDLYAYATEKILKKKIAGKFIVNIKLGIIVSVD